MKNATLIDPERLNLFEVLQVSYDMEQKHPDVLYTISPGNNCIWVHYGLVNLYYIFRDGKIADIQVD